MKDVKTLVFDWSGTLVDDLDGVVLGVNAVMEKFGGRQVTRETFVQEFRLPYDEYYEEVLPGVDLGEIEDEFRRVFDVSWGRVFPLEHAKAMLDWGKARGMRMVVLSSAHQEAVEGQAETFGFKEYFEEIHGSVIHKEEVACDIMERFGDEGRIVFFGDMVHDVRSAKEAGMVSAALLTGYDTAQRLAPECPDYLLPDLAAFMRMHS